MASLADLAGVPTSTVSRIESGKIRPTAAMLQRLASAAGYRITATLDEAGSDQPLADALTTLEEAGEVDKVRAFDRLASVASAAPAARRQGARRVAVPQSVTRAVASLHAQGLNPVVSGMEAVAEQLEPTRSFIPIVYVDDPLKAQGFEPAGPLAHQVMLLLPTTDNVRRWARYDTPVPMTTREWAILDAMSSPGRQSELARQELKTRSLPGNN
jgi:transcriptional regulator with XRE-family HTH domain